VGVAWANLNDSKEAWSPLIIIFCHKFKTVHRRFFPQMLNIPIRQTFPLNLSFTAIWPGFICTLFNTASFAAPQMTLCGGEFWD
jgi:hypothetical protein